MAKVQLLPETSEIDALKFGFDTNKAMSLPLGMASPLWMAFAGAAAAGAAFWWMSRWTSATNLEAMAGWSAKATDDAAETVESTLETVLATVEAAQETVAEATAEAVSELVPEPLAEPVIEALVALAPEPVAEVVPAPVAEAEPVIEAAPEPAPEAAPEVVAEPMAEAAPEPVAPPVPDDLTRIVGIGPKLSAALAARGLTTFAHLAALTAADLADLDQALDLKGRAVRDAWVAQATRFADNV